MGVGGKPERFAASGALSQTRRVIIDSVTLVTAAAAAAVTVKEGGSGGTVVWEGKLSVNADSTQFPFPQGMAVTEAYVTLTGAGAVAVVVFR